MTSHGVPLETAYPYSALNFNATAGSLLPTAASGICSNTVQKKLPAGSTTKAYNSISDNALKTLLNKSPVTALIATNRSFQSYRSGVFACERAANISDINHAVEIIGYDASGNYLIKNSWDVSWGVNGYGSIDPVLDCGIKLFLYQIENTAVAANITDPSKAAKVKGAFNVVFVLGLAVVTMII